jgi:hypothetical protein
MTPVGAVSVTKGVLNRKYQTANTSSCDTYLQSSSRHLGFVEPCFESIVFSDIIRGSQIAGGGGAKLLGRPNFVRWRLICLGPRCVTCFLPPFRRLKFGVRRRFLGNLYTPGHNRFTLL